MALTETNNHNFNTNNGLFRKNAERCILEKLLQSTVQENSVDVTHSKRKDDTEYLEIHLSETAVLRAKLKRFLSFNRFRLLGNVELIDHDQVKTIDDPLTFLSLVKDCWLSDTPETANDTFESFCNEVKNCIANLTEFESAHEHDRRELMTQCSGSIETSLDWVLRQRKTDNGFSSLIYYEQCNVHGHPAHPCSKCRMGFSPDEIKDYSPECNATVPLIVVAVDKNLCCTTLIPGSAFHSVSDILFHDFEGLHVEVEREMKSRNLDFDKYDYLPVHPWQMRHVIQTELFVQSVRDSSTIPLKNITIRTKPLTSVRSLAPDYDSGHSRHHFKIPLNILITSDYRLISPRETESGPKISALLQKALEDTADFRAGKFRLQKEVAGAFYTAKEDTEYRNLSRNLCCIVKENLEFGLNENEITMPASSLIEKSLISNKLILTELVERYFKCNSSHFESASGAARAFFNEYLSLGTQSILTLLGRYGIALEAHLQNSVPVFRSDGRPVALIVRDFSDIRMSKERLAKQGYTLSLEAVKKSHIFGDTMGKVRSNVIHAYVKNHIGELVICLSQEFLIPEQDLWKDVKKQFQEVFDELKRDGQISDQVAEDEEAFFQPEISVKALTRMRILGEVSNYLYVNVPNPLNKACLL